MQATLLERTASTISDAIAPLQPVDEILVCGGGAHNSALLSRLQTLLEKSKITSTATLGLNPDWVEAMTTLINSKKPDVFRWHDSGDVQDFTHLMKIFQVCKLSPAKRHWMPTREAWIKDHMHMAPANLVVRFSSPMVDQGPVKSWANTSTVSTKSRSCPAPDNNNECGDCRACWDPLVKNIEYGKH